MSAAGRPSIVEMADRSEVARAAATRVLAAVRAAIARRGAAVLMLPAGASPLGLYAELRARRAASAAVADDLARVTVFTLDEVVGLPSDHPATFATFLRREAIEPLGVRAFDHLRSDAPDPAAECARYASAIAAAGGIDLAVLGLGRNGHLGYNEPGTPFDAGCHVVPLTGESLSALRRYHPELEPLPSSGMTAGLGTLRAARELMLLAFGREKAAIVAAALDGPLDPAVPATMLRLHPRASAWLDRAAASRLVPS